MISTLASAVRYHRRRAGLSQAALARLAGVGKTVVFDIEKGKRTVRLETLLKVLRALNISLEWHSPLADDFARHRQSESGLTEPLQSGKGGRSRDAEAAGDSEPESDRHAAR